MLIIDRFEGEFAVIECGDTMLHLPIDVLPANAKEGDVLRLVLDEEETRARAVRIRRRMESLFD